MKLGSVDIMTAPWAWPHFCRPWDGRLTFWCGPLLVMFGGSFRHRDQMR